MSDGPVFSVVLATYGRGRHIAPTIESVLRQDFGNFELLVVGDGCSDETESTVRSFSDKRIDWHNLPRNMRSQSFPNNEGIRVARGEWIAYIGHDDLWAPNHLSTIHTTSMQDKDADFIVAGSALHTPPGVGIYHVHGLFKDPDTAGNYFFPPSSVAHRRRVAEQIGFWRDPYSTAWPVDHDFMWRAIEAGLKFVSTGIITTHKFTATQRYLSYLSPNSDEQRDMLEALGNGTAPDPAQIVASAKRTGTYMVLAETSIYETSKPGLQFERHRQDKGLSRPQLTPLLKRTVIKQTSETRGLDWQHFKRRWPQKFRWSGPNPRPKILIPFTGRRARITLKALNTDLSDLSMSLDGTPIPLQIRKGWLKTWHIVAEIPLKAHDYTVLTLEKPTVPQSALYPHKDDRPVGLAVADIVLDPIA